MLDWCDINESSETFVLARKAFQQPGEHKVILCPKVLEVICTLVAAGGGGAVGVQSDPCGGRLISGGGGAGATIKSVSNFFHGVRVIPHQTKENDIDKFVIYHL